jgi:hypothetical protein
MTLIADIDEQMMNPLKQAEKQEESPESFLTNSLLHVRR